MLGLRETINALQFLVLFFSLFFCQPCNIRPSHIWHYRPFHNLKSYVFCDFLIPSKNGFGHFKEQLKRQARVDLRKELLVILCSAVRKLNKLSIISLLITNYSSVYSIFLFYLSNYFTILLVVVVPYKWVPRLAEGCY